MVWTCDEDNEDWVKKCMEIRAEAEGRLEDQK